MKAALEPLRPLLAAAGYGENACVAVSVARTLIPMGGAVYTHVSSGTVA